MVCGRMSYGKYQLMNEHLIVVCVSLVFFILWGIYFAFVQRLRHSPWGVFIWFPFTASSGLIVLYWISEYCSVRHDGGGEAQGWASLGVGLGLIVAVPAAFLFVLSILGHPARDAFQVTPVVLTILFYLASLGCVAAPSFIAHQQSLCSIRLHFVDDTGSPLSGISVVLWGDHDYYLRSNAEGNVMINGTRTRPFNGQFSSFGRSHKTKLVGYAYHYKQSPEPHFTASYHIMEGPRATTKKVIKEDYPFQGKVTDITVRLERE